MVEKTVGWLTPERIELYPMAISITTWLLWGISILLGSGLTDISGQVIGADFLSFYNGGKFFLSGRTPDLYNLSALIEFQKGVVAPSPLKGIYVFTNPPFNSVLYAPFSLGSYATGLLLWWGAGLLVLALSLHLLHQELKPLSHLPTGRLFWISFLFFPTIAWFLFGQNTALSLLVYTMTFVMLRRQRDLEAGMALGLLFYKPQLAIAMAVMLLFRWRWRALIGMALTVSAWIGAGFAISPEAMREYVRLAPRLMEFMRLHDLNPTWGDHSFYAFSTLLLDGFSRRGADLLAFLLIAGGVGRVALLWAHTCWRPGTRTWDLTLAATLALGLLISPHLFLYDLMLLLLPLAILWSCYPQGTGDRLLDGGHLLFWTAALYIITFAGSYLSLAQMQLSAALGLPRMAVQLSVPVIIGWVWVIVRMARDPAVPDSSAGQT